MRRRRSSSWSTLYLGGADRDKLDPILDACVAVYKAQLDEDGQVDFKGKAKAFAAHLRLPRVDPAVHQRRVGEAVDLPELPHPEAAGAEGRGPVEGHPRSDRHGQLPRREAGGDADSACRRRTPRSSRSRPTGGGHKPEPELDRLSNILKTFNDQFGNIPWTDADRVHKLITEDIPAAVAADKAYQNAKQNSDKQNARIEHDKALARVMTAVLKDDTELFKQFSDNESFRRWLTDTVFGLTYEAP